MKNKYTNNTKKKSTCSIFVVIVVVALFEYKGSHLKLVKIGTASAIIL